MNKNIELSARLQMLADMVTPGNRAADVGCDHGFLSIYLVEQGIAPGALAMDVRTGPLAAAKEHVAERKLGDRIVTRLSDGLLAYHAGEADTMICAGMGGKLMARILSDSPEKAKAMKELILQPQSELDEFRHFLRDNGYVIMAENAVFEDGKYYFAMKARYVGPEQAKAALPVSEEELRLADAFGYNLLRDKNPVLKDFLLFREAILENIAQGLRAEDSERTRERLQEIQAEQQLVRSALNCF